MRVRRADELKMDTTFEQWITHVRDVGAADRQEPRVFSTEDSLTEDAHPPRLGAQPRHFVEGGASC